MARSWEDPTVQCALCEQTFSRFDLRLCPICHKQTCERCGLNKGGKHFCSQYCAEYFFYGGGEDDDEMPEDAG